MVTNYLKLPKVVVVKFNATAVEVAMAWHGDIARVNEAKEDAVSDLGIVASFLLLSNLTL